MAAVIVQNGFDGSCGVPRMTRNFSAPFPSEESGRGGGQDDQREGSKKKKIATNAGAATVQRISFLRARLPIRITAVATMAKTAGFNP